MSEKKSESQEFDKKLKKTAREMEEQDLKKEQIPKKPMEDTKKAMEKTEGHKTVEKAEGHKTVEKTEGHKPVEKTEGHKTVEKTEGHKTVKKIEGHKTVEETGGHKAVEKTEGHKTVEKREGHKTVEKIEGHKTETSQNIKTTFKTSDKPEDPKVTETCQMSKTVVEMSTSNIPDKFEAVEKCQMSKTTSKKSTSTKSEASKECQIPKTTSKISTFNKGGDPEDPETVEICQMPKTTSEISISTKFETPKEPSECPIQKTTSEISTSENREVPQTCEIHKTTAETSTSNKFENNKVPETCQTSDMPEGFLECEHEDILTLIKAHQITKKPSKPFDYSQIPLSTELLKLHEAVTDEYLKTKTEEMKLARAAEREAAKANQVSKDATLAETLIKRYSFQGPKVAENNENDEIIKRVMETYKTTKEPEISEVCRTNSMFKISDQMPKDDATTAEAHAIINSTNSGSFQGSRVAENDENNELMKRVMKAYKIAKEFEISEEVRRTNSMSKIFDKTKESEIPEVRRTQSTVSQTDIVNLHDIQEVVKCGMKYSEKYESEIANVLSEIDRITLESNTKDTKDNSTKINESVPEETSTKSTDDTGKIVMLPVIEKESVQNMISCLRRVWPLTSVPNYDNPYLVLATHHLVPSLPIKLFEIFADMIEVVTERPVVLLHECRNDRPIAKEIADIVVLPASETWKDGVLLPASFVFEHHLNKDNSARVYADVIVRKDRAPYIKDIMDLRGYHCAMPVNRYQCTAPELLFSYLHEKGENMIFFGSILDADTQLEVLEMVASKQAEIGILESPVIKSHTYTLLGMDSLQILTSLGPLPPYRIMIKNTLVNSSNNLLDRLTNYLLNATQYKVWMERFLPYGVIGFAENSTDHYDGILFEKKAEFNVPYY